MTTAAIWVTAVAAVFGVIVSFFALHSSNAALKSSNIATEAVQNAERVNERIELALQKFEKVLMDSIESKYASKELFLFYMKNMDEKLGQLDHRLTRNSEHVNMMLQTLLNKGMLTTVVTATTTPNEDKNV